MIEEVQTRTQAQIHDACEPDTPVLIEAPPASGKTYSAVRLAAAGHKVLYLAGRTALYEQARAEVEELTAEHGEEISVETIPSPNRNCPTFQGKNSGNTERFKRLYARGMTAKQIHLESSPDSMPCDFLPRLQSWASPPLARDSVV